MNSMNSQELADFLAAVTTVVDRFHEETGETADAVFIILSVIGTVDNCVDELKSIEFVVTAAGYELRFEPEGDAVITEDMMDDWLSRGLTMAEEDLFEAWEG